MMDFVEVARAHELPPGRVKSVKVGSETIVLIHTMKGFFASESRCPHRGGPLAEGDVIGDEIVCPWHLWSFNVETGACPGNPEINIVTHEVKIDGDRILVRLSPVRETSANLL